MTHAYEGATKHLHVNAAKEAVVCRDAVLATLQINGSGQDSGCVDFRIDCNKMEKACRTDKKEVLRCLRQLLATVREHYGEPEQTETSDYT